MPLLHIALQDGFTGEPAVIRVDGHEIYRNDHLRTRTQIGFADSVETTHAGGPAKIELDLRGTTTTITPTVAEDTYIGLSVGPEGGITERVSARRFAYV